MIIHEADSRGSADHGWLKSYHSFSFADYYDPKRMGFGTLRVINDDTINPGTGFGTHPHRDMEIVTIPLEGTVAHKDSVGNETTITQGEVQIMSAGKGILHSEFNASQTETLKLLQIWVLPKIMRVAPRYEQKTFQHEDRSNRFVTVVSPDGREGSVTINQDAFFSLGDLTPGHVLHYERKLEGNGVYLFIIAGKVKVEDQTLKARDGMGLTDFQVLEIEAQEKSEILVMEIPYPSST